MKKTEAKPDKTELRGDIRKDHLVTPVLPGTPTIPSSAISNEASYTTAAGDNNTDDKKGGRTLSKLEEQFLTK